MRRLKPAGLRKNFYAVSLVFLIWYLLHLTLQSAAIPSPIVTFLNFISILPGTLSLHLLASLGRIAVAIIFSLMLGSLIGLFIGVNKRADALITPVLYILYPIPKIAFLPILMILLGLGNTPKIVLIILIIIFQIMLAVRDGVKEIPKELLYSVASLGLNRGQMYKHLYFPAVLPKIMTALRLSVGVSISVLFFGENFATTYGIGYFIMNSFLMVNYVEMYSGILALSLMGLILFRLIDLAEGWLCQWIRAGRKGHSQ